MERGIPLVDLDLFVKGNDTDRKSFVQQLGDAFHHVGFVGVVNHGVPKDLVDTFYREAKAFFSMPIEVKRKYEIAGMAGQRGYTSFGKEHAKQSNVGDLKEFYQIGQEVPEELRYSEDYPDNIAVDEIPGFLDTGRRLYRAFEGSGGALLRAIALHLDLEEGYFDSRIVHGNSILRAIHYPPITEEPKSAIRSEQHEDINLITLLVGASSGGLQVMNKEGAWVDVMPGEEEIVVNVGDMLQRLTNNYLKSTTHRVVNPPRQEWHRPRLSIPFFLHPQSAMDLTCLPGTVSDAQPLEYEPITAGAYLDERLAEIGLKK
jgi:isopenicillin N synthase-like dioxygenase